MKSAVCSLFSIVLHLSHLFAISLRHVLLQTQMPSTSTWLSSSSVIPPASAQEAKAGKGMFPVWALETERWTSWIYNLAMSNDIFGPNLNGWSQGAGSALTMTSSTSSGVGGAPLTKVIIMSISLLLIVPFPSKSKAWNWNLRATSVVVESSTAFFKTVIVCGSLLCHLLAYKLLSSKYLLKAATQKMDCQKKKFVSRMAIQSRLILLKPSNGKYDTAPKVEKPPYATVYIKGCGHTDTLTC